MIAAGAKAFGPNGRGEAYLVYTNCAGPMLGLQEQKILPARNGELKLAHRTTGM